VAQRIGTLLRENYYFEICVEKGENLKLGIGAIIFFCFLRMGVFKRVDGLNGGECVISYCPPSPTPDKI